MSTLAIQTMYWDENMAIHPDADRRATYEAIGLFVDAALRNDDSIFTQGTAIWSPTVIGDLYHRFVEQPDESSDSFTTKLERQLKNAPSETAQLAAEVLFVQQLTPYKVKGSTKKRLIQTVGKTFVARRPPRVARVKYPA